MKSNSHLKFNKVSIKGQGKDILFYKLDNSLNFMAGLLALKWRLLGIKVKWDGGILDNYPSDPGSYDSRPGPKILFHCEKYKNTHNTGKPERFLHSPEPETRPSKQCGFCNYLLD